MDGDCRFKVSAEDGFTFNVDATTEKASCPTEILLSALGSCSATDVVLLLQDQGVEVKGLENTVTFALTESEPRLYKCHVCLLSPTIDITCSAEVGKNCN